MPRIAIDPTVRSHLTLGRLSKPSGRLKAVQRFIGIL